MPVSPRGAIQPVPAAPRGTQPAARPAAPAATVSAPRAAVVAPRFSAPQNIAPTTRGAIVAQAPVVLRAPLTYNQNNYSYQPSGGAATARFTAPLQTVPADVLNYRDYGDVNTGAASRSHLDQGGYPAERSAPLSNLVAPVPGAPPPYYKLINGGRDGYLTIAPQLDGTEKGVQNTGRPTPEIIAAAEKYARDNNVQPNKVKVAAEAKITAAADQATIRDRLNTLNNTFDGRVSDTFTKQLNSARDTSLDGLPASDVAAHLRADANAGYPPRIAGKPINTPRFVTNRDGTITRYIRDTRGAERITNFPAGSSPPGYVAPAPLSKYQRAVQGLLPGKDNAPIPQGGINAQQRNPAALPSYY